MFNVGETCEGDDWCRCARCVEVYGDVMLSIDGTCKINA